MINIKKLRCLNKIGLVLFVFCTFTIADDSLYLWDFGVKIDLQPQPKIVLDPPTTNVIMDKKYAALTKRHINPKIINVELKRNVEKEKNKTIQQFSTLNYLEQYILGNILFTSERYVEAIKLLEMVDFIMLSNKQKTHLMQLHASALFNLGQYNRVVNILRENKEYDLNDELLFLLGMSSTEIGNKITALHAFNEIIENHPNSDYQNLAKLQARVLKR